MSFFALPSNQRIILEPTIDNYEIETCSNVDKIVNDSIVELIDNKHLDKQMLFQHHALFEYLQKNVSIQYISFFTAFREIVVTFDKINQHLFDKSISLLSDESLVMPVKEYMNTLNIPHKTLVANGCARTKNTHFDLIILNMEENIDRNIYFHLMLEKLVTLGETQKTSGSAVLRMSYLNTSHTSRFLYFLTSMYEKVFVMKSRTSWALDTEKYVVCLNFLQRTTLSTRNLKVLKNMHGVSSPIMYNILGFETPCIFQNKVHDINLMLAQLQLDQIDTIINAMKKNGSGFERLEIIRKNQVNLRDVWLEKYHTSVQPHTGSLHV